MNDSGFSSGDAVLTAAMSGGAFGGNRGGLWGNNGGIVPEVAAFNTLSDGTATKEAIDGNREFTKVGLDRLADTVAVSSRGREFDRVNDSVADLSRDVANGKLDNVERANLNTIKILETSAASDAKLAECCCKQSLQACKDHADLKATIISESNATRALSLEIEGRANVSALAAANAKITQLETINALSQRCGCNGWVGRCGQSTATRQRPSAKVGVHTKCSNSDPVDLDDIDNEINVNVNVNVAPSNEITNETNSDIKGGTSKSDSLSKSEVEAKSDSESSSDTDEHPGGNPNS